VDLDVVVHAVDQEVAVSRMHRTGAGEEIDGPTAAAGVVE
jgi:hypothetical protein